MKIDCLCITTSSRKRFKNWVLWNYLKQTHYNKELVVVSDDDDWPDWVTVVKVSRKENIPTKRNIALGAASGDAITWFDDDDWQHSEKLHIIASHVDFKTNVGCSNSFFYDTLTSKICDVNIHPKPIFNSIGVMRYGLPAFSERIEIGSDTDWLRKLEYRGNFISHITMFFWLLHGKNTTLNRNKINAVDPMRFNLGAEDWQQLRKLEANLKIG